MHPASGLVLLGMIAGWKRTCGILPRSFPQVDISAVLSAAQHQLPGISAINFRSLDSPVAPVPAIGSAPLALHRLAQVSTDFRQHMDTQVLRLVA